MNQPTVHIINGFDTAGEMVVRCGAVGAVLATNMTQMSTCPKCRGKK